MAELQSYGFPFLFGGTFIEGFGLLTNEQAGVIFPFLFGGTFIEGKKAYITKDPTYISLPFRRDFH